MTRSDVGVSDALFERVRSEFDDDAIIELTGLIAFQNMSSKFNAALGVPAQGFCPMPSAGGGGLQAKDRASVRYKEHGGPSGQR
jgi:hypothetical protein